MDNNGLNSRTDLNSLYSSLFKSLQADMLFRFWFPPNVGQTAPASHGSKPTRSEWPGELPFFCAQLRWLTASGTIWLHQVSISIQQPLDHDRHGHLQKCQHTHDWFKFCQRCTWSGESAGADVSCVRLNVKGSQQCCLCFGRSSQYCTCLGECAS